MSKYIVTNRKRENDSWGDDIQPRGEVSYLLDGEEVRAATFRSDLLGSFIASDESEAPRIILKIHGFNVDFEESEAWVDRIEDGIGRRLGNAIIVGFSWPSDGSVLRYLSDSHDARASAEALAHLIIRTIRFLQGQNCPAELCIIAHSRGCYLLAHALRLLWEENGRPRTHSVFSEILLVAADLDAEALEKGSLGESTPIFARRVTVYYSKSDKALLASSVKRAGITGARLGRSGPGDDSKVPNNVVSVEVARSATSNDEDAHSAYFHPDSDAVLTDMVQTLGGEDRGQIEGRQSLDFDRFILNGLP